MSGLVASKVSHSLPESAPELAPPFIDRAVETISRWSGYVAMTAAIAAIVVLIIL